MFGVNLVKFFIVRKNFENNNKMYLNPNNNIINTINTCTSVMFAIFGIIITFNILSFLLINVLKLNARASLIIKSIIEMMSGISSIAHSKLTFSIKLILSYLTLSFGGLCIHMQIFSIVNNKKIRYLKYLIFRIF